VNPLSSQRGILLVLLATVWLLNACSVAPHRESLPGKTINPEEITHWQIIGKIAYRSPERNSSGRLRWKQQDSQFNIGLSGPLGRGVMNISGTQQEALIEITGQESYHTTEPERTLREQTGTDIPLNALLYWIRGIPAPNQASHYQLDTVGRNINMKQAGWNLEYSKYRAVNGFWLPGKISIRKQDKLLLLVINQWILPNNSAQFR